MPNSMATIIVRESPAVKCSNRFSVFDADVLAMIYRRDYLKHKAIACKDRILWAYGRTIDRKEMQLRVSYVNANDSNVIFRKKQQQNVYI